MGVCDRVQSIQQELGRVGEKQREMERGWEEMRGRVEGVEEREKVQPPDYTGIIKNTELALEQKI